MSTKKQVVLLVILALIGVGVAYYLTDDWAARLVMWAMWGWIIGGVLDDRG